MACSNMPTRQGPPVPPSKSLESHSFIVLQDHFYGLLQHAYKASPACFRFHRVGEALRECAGKAAQGGKDK